MNSERPSEDLVIRDATSEDGESIASIYNHYIETSVITFEEERVTGSEMEARMAAVRADGYSWLVAESEGNVAGYAYAGRWQKRSAYRHTAEVTVYLHHAFTGRGLGTRLYEAIFTKLHDMEVHAVIGGITLPNPASVALHEKFGMTQVAHYKEVGFKFGRWLDVGYWQVLLK